MREGGSEIRIASFYSHTACHSGHVDMLRLKDFPDVGRDHWPLMCYCILFALHRLPEMLIWTQEL
jgi:hypothetical protein